MMKKILNDIQQKITGEVSALQYVGENWGQLNNPQEMQWPCALIDIGETTWRDLGKNVQQGVMSIGITVASTQPTGTTDYETFDILESIHKSLQGFVSDLYFGPLTRTSNKRLDRDDNIRAYELIYTCQVVDKSTMPEFTTIMASAKIDQVGML